MTDFPLPDPPARRTVDPTRRNNPGRHEFAAHTSKDMIGLEAMTTAAQYRQYAEECLTAMRAALIPEVQAALFTAAQRWIEEADRAQRSEDEEPPPAAV